MSPPFRPVSLFLCALLLGSSGVSAQPLHAPKTASPVSSKTPAVNVRPLTTIDDSTPAVSSLRLSARVFPPSRPTSSSFGQAHLGSSLDLQTSTGDLRARLLAPAERPPARRDEVQAPHFGRALFGSTLGAGIGTGLGLLLLNEASRINDEDERTPGRSTTKEEAASIAAMIGIVCIVAGGPFGAVQMGRIERRRNDAYVGAAVGEFVFGALGYVAANRLGGNSSSRLAGLGVGVAVGSAAGAVLVASQQQKQRGLFRRDNGNWTVAPPSVRVQPNLSSRRSPSVHVSLLSLRW